MRVVGSNEWVVRAFVEGRAESGRSFNCNLYFEGDVLYSYGQHWPLAIKKDGYFFVNNDENSITTRRHRGLVENIAPLYSLVLVPFSAVINMVYPGLYNYKNAPDIIRRFKVVSVSCGGAVIDLESHFFLITNDDTGAKGANNVFIIEIDNKQIEKYGEPETVFDALELLKPDEVKEAESDGAEVYRQGEWFFVQAGKEVNPKEIIKKYKLQGRNDGTAAHIASEGFTGDDGRQYVRGIIRHESKQHKQLKLYNPKYKERKWFIAYESMQRRSLAANGNFD